MNDLFDRIKNELKTDFEIQLRERDIRISRLETEIASLKSQAQILLLITLSTPFQPTNHGSLFPIKKRILVCNGSFLSLGTLLSLIFNTIKFSQARQRLIVACQALDVRKRKSTWKKAQVTILIRTLLFMPEHVRHCFLGSVPFVTFWCL